MPRTGKDRRPVGADPGDGETSDPDTPEASDIRDWGKFLQHSVGLATEIWAGVRL